jgi:hypothetical protein
VTAPTREQLLVLADRAERGPLTAAEAARLRQGIAALYARRPPASSRRARQLQALASLVAAARRRGEEILPVALVEAALDRSHVVQRPRETAPVAA